MMTLSPQPSSPLPLISVFACILQDSHGNSKLSRAVSSSGAPGPRRAFQIFLIIGIEVTRRKSITSDDCVAGAPLSAHRKTLFEIVL